MSEITLSPVTDEQGKGLKRIGFPSENINSVSLELAAKWLREEKDFGIYPYKDRTGGWAPSEYRLQIVLPHSTFETDPDGYNSCLGIVDTFETFDKAISRGIDIAINLL